MQGKTVGVFVFELESVDKATKDMISHRSRFLMNGNDEKKTEASMKGIQKQIKRMEKVLLSSWFC